MVGVGRGLSGKLQWRLKRDKALIRRVRRADAKITPLQNAYRAAYKSWRNAYDRSEKGILGRWLRAVEVWGTLRNNYRIACQALISACPHEIIVANNRDVDLVIRAAGEEVYEIPTPQQILGVVRISREVEGAERRDLKNYCRDHGAGVDHLSDDEED